MPPYIPSTKPIGIIVVESPGYDEVREGEPLVGRTGQELNAGLLSVGLVREKLLLINAVACRPKEPKTEAEMRLAVKCCQPLFWSYLHGLETTPTLICGKWANLAAVGTDKSVFKSRGFHDLTFKLAPKDTK